MQDNLIPDVWAGKVMDVLTERLPFAFTPRTEEERAAALARFDAREEYVERLAEMLASPDDLTVRAIADLHKQDAYGQCDGCDFGGYDAEPVRWPCRTSVKLGAILGLVPHA
jgi:hypothetical protein